MPPKGIFKRGGRGLATTTGILLGHALREEGGRGGDVIIGSKKSFFFRGQGRGDRILFWVLFWGGIRHCGEGGGRTIKPLRRLVGEKNLG